MQKTQENSKQLSRPEIYVAKTPNSGNLISATTAQDLWLISLHINKVTESKDKNRQNHIEALESFQRLGKIERRTDKTTQPPKHNPRGVFPTMYETKSTAH